MGDWLSFPQCRGMTKELRLGISFGDAAFASGFRASRGNLRSMLIFNDVFSDERTS